jgi:hypothetical protein
MLNQSTNPQVSSLLRKRVNIAPKKAFTLRRKTFTLRRIFKANSN